MKFEQFVNILLGDDLELISEQFKKRGAPSRTQKMGELATVNVPSPSEFTDKYQTQIDELFYDAAESGSYKWIGNITDKDGNKVSPSEFMGKVVEALEEDLSAVGYQESSKTLIDPVKGTVRDAVDTAAKEFTIKGKNTTTSKFVTRIIINVLLNSKTKKLAGFDFQYDKPFVGPAQDAGETPADSALPTKDSDDSADGMLKVVKSVSQADDKLKADLERIVSDSSADDVLKVIRYSIMKGDTRNKSEIVTDISVDLRDEGISGNASEIVSVLIDNGFLQPAEETDSEDKKDIDPEKDEIPGLEFDDEDEVISRRDVYGLTGQEGRADRFLPGDDF